MTHGSRRNRTVSVGALSRVEGEGGLEVVVRDGQVKQARLDIYEPPRFFEALLRGRQYTEPPDITARICGICPVAYQMSACAAIEDACGVAVPAPIEDLRRLLYCGEWIESHALHIYLLHAPDFLGYESGIHLARDHADLVQRGLRLKRAGNRLMEVIGGRSVHPVNVRIGGFYRAPDLRSVRELAGEIERAREVAIHTVRWVAGFPFPDFARDYHVVSLRQDGQYPICGSGRIVSSRGLDIAVAEYDEHFTEEHVPHSTALHSRLRLHGDVKAGGVNAGGDGAGGDGAGGDGTYLVGPMARYSLNSGLLPGTVKEEARAAGLGPACVNPFQSIIVRAIELLYACEEALRLIGSYEPPDPPWVAVPARAATGFGCSEAPRGLLYHRYRIAEDGAIEDAKIVPPTSQNQRAIEADLRSFVQDRLDVPQERLTWECEQAVRNHDPCISCAAHFLDVRVVRE